MMLVDVGCSWWLSYANLVRAKIEGQAANAALFLYHCAEAHHIIDNHELATLCAANR
jgi:hypothetical protein